MKLIRKSCLKFTLDVDIYSRKKGGKKLEKVLGKEDEAENPRVSNKKKKKE